MVFQFKGREPAKYLLGWGMRRRDFIAIIGNAAVGWPLAASAQEAGRPPALEALQAAGVEVHRA